MKKSTPAANPDAYVAALSGWQRRYVETLRAAVRAGARLHEVVKWGNLVSVGHGPVLMIRAEESRVLLGFWRGQRLRALEPRLKPGGKYEMATLELREGTTLSPALVRRLAKEAAALDGTLGDPTLAAKPSGRRATGRKAAARPAGQREVGKGSAADRGAGGRTAGKHAAGTRAAGKPAAGKRSSRRRAAGRPAPGERRSGGR